MGQGVGHQLSSSVRVTVFEPLLVKPSQGSSVFIVLRYAGPSGQQEEHVDCFPASYVLPVSCFRADLPPADREEVALTVLVVEAGSAQQFKEGTWREIGQVSVPLAELRRHQQLTGSQSKLQDGWASCFMLGLGTKAGPPLSSPVVGVPEGVPMFSLATPAVQNEDVSGRKSQGFDWSFVQDKEDMPALDAHAKFREAQSLGQKMDAPKLLIAFSDPALDTQKEVLVGPSWLNMTPGQGSDPLGGMLTTQRPAGENLREVVRQVDAMMRGLHSSLDKESEAVVGGTSAQVQRLGELACDSLASQNEVLRDRLEHEQHCYDAEVRQLRLEYRAVQLGGRRAASLADETSDSEIEGAELEEVGAVNHLPQWSPEEKRRRVLIELEEVQEQIEALQQELMHGRTRLAAAEHAALTADKEKEQVLNNFSAVSGKLENMSKECQEYECLKEALLLATSGNSDAGDRQEQRTAPREVMSWLVASGFESNRQEDAPQDAHSWLFARSQASTKRDAS